MIIVCTDNVQLKLYTDEWDYMEQNMGLHDHVP